MRLIHHKSAHFRIHVTPTKKFENGLKVKIYEKIS